MGSGLFFPISAIFISVLILLMFFNKKHINTVETKLYTWLIVTNFFGLIIEFCCTFAAYINDKLPLMSNIILKLYLVYIITWAIIFTVYIFVISHEKEYMIKIKNKAKIIVIICYWISVLIIFSLPIKLVIENNFSVRYTEGPSVIFIYALSSLIVIIMLYCMIRNFKNLKSKKYLPLFVFLVVGAGSMYFQMLNPGLLLITSVETYIILLMYFTIENPDMKMIEEIIKNKNIADNNNEKKTFFIYDIVQNLRRPLSNIRKVIKDYNSNYIDINNCLNEVVQETTKADLIINDTLDISNLSSEKIFVYKDNYDLKIMIKQLQVKYKNLISKDVNFIVNVSNDVPNHLYGDVVRLKQIINSILDNSLKYTKKGFIELTIYPIYEREVKILKRLTENYYTVEKLKELYDKRNGNNTDKLTQQIASSYRRETTNKINKIVKNVKKEQINKNQIDLILSEIRKMFENKIINETKDENNVYTLEVATTLNAMDIEKIKKLLNNAVTIEIANNYKVKKTIISFWDEHYDMERKV